VNSGLTLTYRRRASPLHAARASVAGAYGGALAGAGLISNHPLVLGGLVLSVLCAGAAAGVGRELLRAAKLAALPLALLTVLVNLVVSRSGLTVFARLGDWGVFGQVDLTVEALVYGLLVALRLLVVMLACALAVATVDPDELLRGLRRVSHRSALTATLATRLVLVLGEDARRLGEAQRCRPDAPLRRLGGRLGVVRAVVASALDRSLDVAGALEVRGYGGGLRPARSRQPWSRHDLAFAAAACLLLGAAVVTSATGLTPTRVYPLLDVPVGSFTVLLAAGLPLLALIPFLNRRGIEP
jgi:energy-coupling factor transport system permease protein